MKRYFWDVTKIRDTNLGFLGCDQLVYEPYQFYKNSLIIKNLDFCLYTLKVKKLVNKDLKKIFDPEKSFLQWRSQ